MRKVNSFHYIEVDMGKKDLIIVGAGGFGCEAVDVAEGINNSHPEWNILGFLDDNKEVGSEIFRGYKVIGKINDWQPKDTEYFSLGVSSPQVKCKLYNLMKAKGANFATLIAPNVYVPKEMIIGEGCTITLAWLGSNVRIGKCVDIRGSMVGDSTIDDFSTTTGFTNIAGATIGKRVFVGSHAVVLNGVKVGDDAFVCAGSVVFTKVKPGIKVMGNPAKKMEF